MIVRIETYHKKITYDDVINILKSFNRQLAYGFIYTATCQAGTPHATEVSLNWNYLTDKKFNFQGYRLVIWVPGKSKTSDHPYWFDYDAKSPEGLTLLSYLYGGN